MTSFGFPTFRWQVSPISNIQYLYNCNLLGNVKYAIEISLQTFHEHWAIYVNSAKNWWLREAESEALRTAFDLVHGNITGVLKHNFLMVMFLPFISYYLFKQYASIVLIAFTIARNIPVYPFSIVAP